MSKAISRAEELSAKSVLVAFQVSVKQCSEIRRRTRLIETKRERQTESNDHIFRPTRINHHP